MSEAASEDLHALAKPGQLQRLRRAWRLQHLGWAAIAVLVLAGAGGLFGSGPLSSTRLSADGLMLEFDRFIRRGTPFTIEVTVDVPPESSEAKLTLPVSYFDEVKISTLMPQPRSVVASAASTTFVFAVDGSSALTVDIHGEARQPGLLQGEIAAGDRRLQFTQFVWP